MYNTVYFHRTVRAIDLDLEEVVRAVRSRRIFGDGNPLDDLAAYAALDEYALLHQASLWAGGEARWTRTRRPAPGRVTPDVGRLWRGILLRQPDLAGDRRGPARLALRRAPAARSRPSCVRQVDGRRGGERQVCGSTSPRPTVDPRTRSTRAAASSSRGATGRSTPPRSTTSWSACRRSS